MKESESTTQEAFRESRKIISETPLDELTYRLIKEKLEQLDRPQITKCIQDPEQWKILKSLMTVLIQEKAEKRSSPSLQSSTDNDNSGAEDASDKETLTPTIQSKSPKISKARKSPDTQKTIPSAESQTEQIQKLKGYVHKCGIRKIWKKELEGMSEGQCIAKLKNILKDLGMEGRPSIAKCNEIREKREFAKEIESLDTRNILPSRRKRGEESSPTEHVQPRAISSDPLDLSALGDPESD